MDFQPYQRMVCTPVTYLCSYPHTYTMYRKLSNIRRTKSQNLNASRLIL